MTLRVLEQVLPPVGKYSIQNLKYLLEEYFLMVPMDAYDESSVSLSLAQEEIVQCEKMWEIPRDQNPSL